MGDDVWYTSWNLCPVSDLNRTSSVLLYPSPSYFTHLKFHTRVPARPSIFRPKQWSVLSIGTIIMWVELLFTCDDVVRVWHWWRSFNSWTSLPSKKIMNLVVCCWEVHLLIKYITWISKYLKISVEIYSNSSTHERFIDMANSLFFPGQGHCAVFFGKTLNSYSASLHPGV